MTPLSFGRNQQPVPHGGRDIPHRFGSMCPVCGSELGKTTARTSENLFKRTPSFRLEVGRRDGEIYPWRFHPLGEPRLGVASSKPLFHDHETEFVYLLCMNGHIFPDSAPQRRALGAEPGSDQYRIDRWRMLAAIGPTGSGKTYLVLRTLMQSLVNPYRATGTGGMNARECALSPLEKIPQNSRLTKYDEMLTTGLPIPATDFHNDEGTPHAIFNETLPNLVEAVQEFIRREVDDGELRAERWGRELRQPLVMRTQYGNRRTWTGVADLPGEQFNSTYADDRANARLGLYDALIWVIDPVLATSMTNWFTRDSVDADDPFDRVLEGSLRPGSVTERADTTTVRNARNRVQQRLGHTLGIVDSHMHNSSGNTRSTLVAVNKCDVIHSALGRNLDNLHDIGNRGAVLKGAKNYLLVNAKLRREEAINPDRSAAALLDHVTAARSASDAVRERIAESVAKGILDYYSNKTRFWALMHGDDHPDEFDTGIPGDVAQWHLIVPTIGDHMNGWNNDRNPARFLQMRDLVMSVVGCGIAYGLGYGESVLALLDLDRHDVRFFLCSPLENVPVARGGGAENQTLVSIDGSFPDVAERSASLTQLLLASLGRAAG